MSEFRIVSPFRPFKPESEEHINLGPFDWLRAMNMLKISAQYCAHTEVVVLTDEKSHIGLPAFRYKPRCNRLMPWILDVSLAYLESEEFDRDTWFISPDMMVMKELDNIVPAHADLMLLSHNEHLPIINHTQFWRHKAKKKLIKFFRQCYERSLKLSEDHLRWGADTEPFINFLDPVPLDGGSKKYQGLNIHFLPRASIALRVNERVLNKGSGHWQSFPVPIAEFTYGRKKHMDCFFERSFYKEMLFARQARAFL